MPPQQRIDEHWYQGTADAVYQNIYTLEKERPEYVVILAGDHIYKMDYLQLVECHKQRKADVTVAALRVRRQRIARISASCRPRPTAASSVFRKSRPCRRRSPATTEHILASMGIYVFTARFLFEQLCLDATRNRQPARFRQGHHAGLGARRIACGRFPFRDENRKRDAYWRDVGTLDAYFEANMDLVLGRSAT